LREEFGARIYELEGGVSAVVIVLVVVLEAA
jgi:hypothetical protein